MGIKNMQGVPAHLEYVGPKGRKRKKSCAYYFEGKCHCKVSNYYLLKCGGRSFCQNFDDSEYARDNYINEMNEIYSYELEDKNTKKKDNYNKKSCISKIENNILTKKIKVEDINNKKKYVFQLVTKEKEDEKACMVYRNSKIGKLLDKCKEGSYVELSLNNEKRKFKIIQIKQE